MLSQLPRPSPSVKHPLFRRWKTYYRSTSQELSLTMTNCLDDVVGNKAIGRSLVTVFGIKKNTVVLARSGHNQHGSTFVTVSTTIAHHSSVRSNGSFG